ncbi:STAS domain-containing protein [Planosporangium thailandense]|uniref:Anti-sigma factor antagonist n=1 Tax=Planosporangium thailandense TaxID=765197 RepID=A0ABX0XXP3_9ACTN|nr:STAS domain-containing protein [Planosporangium thailandense]NJC70687.1 STAS domain-containing protein [Planosporangium thailandense]
MSTGRHRAPLPPLDLTLAEADDTALTLTAHGRLDTATVDDLNDALEVLLAQPGLTHLLLDFGQLTSIDPAGVSALVGAHQDAQRRGITLTVVNCSSAVQRTLEVTGLYGHLTRAEADGRRGQATSPAPSPVPEPRRNDDLARDRERPTSGRTAATAGSHA